MAPETSRDASATVDLRPWAAFRRRTIAIGLVGAVLLLLAGIALGINGILALICLLLSVVFLLWAYRRHRREATEFTPMDLEEKPAAANRREKSNRSRAGRPERGDGVRAERRPSPTPRPPRSPE